MRHAVGIAAGIALFVYPIAIMWGMLSSAMDGRRRTGLGVLGQLALALVMLFILAGISKWGLSG